MPPSSRGILLALIATVLFASVASLSKPLLAVAPPVIIAALSQLMTVAAIVLIWGALPEIKQILHCKRSTLLYLLLVGILAAVLGPLALFAGIQASTATNAVLLSRMESVLTTLLCSLLLREKVTRQQVAGVVLMLLGIYFIVSQGFRYTAQFNPGDLLILFSSLCYAVVNTIFKAKLTDLSPKLVVLMRNLVGSIILLLLLPVLAPSGLHLASLLTGTNLIYLLILGFGVILIGQILWYRSLELISASTVSSVSLSQPLFGVIFSRFLLSETLHPYHLIGGLMVIAGLGFTMLHRQKLPHFELHLWARHWHG